MRNVRMEIQLSATRKHFCHYVFICLVVVLVLTTRYPGMGPDVCANEIKQGDKVTIITPGTEARLCPQPACGPDQHLLRIPEGTVLTILSTEIFAIGTYKVKWFEIVYQDARGWISIYDTDMSKR